MTANTKMYVFIEHMICELVTQVSHPPRKSQNGSALISKLDGNESIHITEF